MISREISLGEEYVAETAQPHTKTAGEVASRHRERHTLVTFNIVSA